MTKYTRCLKQYSRAIIYFPPLLLYCFLITLFPKVGTNYSIILFVFALYLSFVFLTRILINHDMSNVSKLPTSAAVLTPPTGYNNARAFSKLYQKFISLWRNINFET